MCLIMEMLKDNHAMSSENNINWFTYEQLEINRIFKEFSPRRNHVNLPLPSDKYIFRVPAPNVGSPVLNDWGKT